MKWALSFLLVASLTISAVAQSSEKESALAFDLRTAATLTAAGDYADALDLLKGLKADYPDSLDVHIAYQDLRLASGPSKDLVKEYAARASGSAATPDALYLHARLLEGSKAVTIFKKALRLDPRHFEALCGIGSCYVESGKTKEAEQAFRLATEVRRSSAVPWNGLGFLEERRGNLELAEEHYRAAIGIDPGRAISHLNLGTLLILVGDLDEAETVLTEAARLAPGSPMPILARGLLLLARERLPKTDAEVVPEGEGEDPPAANGEGAEGDGPEPPDSGLGLEGLGGKDQPPPAGDAGDGPADGENGEDKEEPETARSLFEKAVELKTNTFTSLNMLGLALTDAREFGLARAALSRATVRDKENPLTYLNLCHMSLMMGQPEPAMAWVRQAIRLDSQSAQAYYFTGLCESAIGKTKNAEIAYLRAVKLDGENVLYWRTLGAHYAMLGKWKEAVRTILGAIDLAGETPELQLDLAFACSGVGNFPKAASLFETVVEENPEELSAWLHLGLIYREKLRSPSKAIFAFEEYKANGGDDPRVDAWLAELRR